MNVELPQRHRLDIKWKIFVVCQNIPDDCEKQKNETLINKDVSFDWFYNFIDIYILGSSFFRSSSLKSSWEGVFWPKQSKFIINNKLHYDHRLTSDRWNCVSYSPAGLRLSFQGMLQIFPGFSGKHKQISSSIKTNIWISSYLIISKWITYGVIYYHVEN